MLLTVYDFLRREPIAGGSTTPLPSEPRINDASPSRGSSVTFRHSELLKYARDPGLRLFAIGITILIYAVELSNFTLSLDEELHAYEAQPWRLWIGQGRWSMALLSYVFPPLATTPFLPTAMFCVALAISGLLLAGCYARSRAEAFAFVGFFVSCPIWLHIAQFNTLSWGFGAGLCLAAGAVALLSLGGYRASILGALATGVAIGVHQSLFLFVVCGSLLSASLRLLDEYRSEPHSLKGTLQHLSLLAVSWSVAVLFYYGVTELTLVLTSQTLVYVDSYIRLTDFTSSATSSIAIDRTIRRLSELLSGTDSTFIRWRWGIASLLLAWMGAFAATTRAFQTSRERLRLTLLAAMLVLGSVLSAALPMIASAGIAPIRSLGAFSVLYAAGAATMFKRNSSWKVPLWLIFSLALFTNAWISATLFNAEAIARDRDRAMARQIAERVAATQGFQRGQARPVILVGRWSHEISGPALRVELFGASFFEPDRPTSDRVVSYLRLLGIQGLRQEQITELYQDVAELERLPTWPAIGSIALVRDVLVIKLGPLSSLQRDRLSKR